MSTKSAAVLFPLFSIPSNFGIGELGKGSYHFIDILAKMKVKIWQILPLTPLEFSNSPYQSSSAFAGDYIYICPDLLVKDGLLDAADLEHDGFAKSKIEYEKIRAYKTRLLKKAFCSFIENGHDDGYKKFIKQHNHWLRKHAIFQTLRAAHNDKPWNVWPEEDKHIFDDPDSNRLSHFAEQIEYEMFLQYLFFKQWLELKQYANDKGIQIMGDIPIYVDHNSVDVWCRQDLFLLNRKGEMTYVAGFPPDASIATGQRWGNPLYDWEAMQKDNFQFWVNRFRHNALLFDMIRIDHFIGFDAFWRIPASCKTAVEGDWIKAPGMELFNTVFKELPDLQLIVEDLGADANSQVFELRDHFSLTGMTIFQFDFNLTGGDNSEFESRVKTNLYPGTHDNNTLLGWYHALVPKEQEKVNKFFDVDGEASPAQLCDAILKYLLSCQAERVYLPIHDILALDSIARVNIPGTTGSPNWEWRLDDFKALEKKIPFIKEQIELNNRT